MTWKQTLDYLYSALPMYQRLGAAAYKANLDNTYAICKLLDDPQHAFKSIHVAGTNGKGSTSHALAAIFAESGYKTGLYTSPHLRDFRERIRINGKMISRQAVTAFTEKYKDAFESIRPSFFEMTVGLAFDHFRRNKVDIAIIETGLGGRLDSTNVVRPVLSLITNIGYDHMNLLGDTLEKIAVEKAGIIKPGVPVIISESDPATSEIFIKKAKKEGSPILFANNLFTVSSVKTVGLTHLEMKVQRNGERYYPCLRIDLPGLYQVKNIKGILAAVEEARKAGFILPEAKVKRALGSVRKLTGIRGRWQVLSRKPLTICDTGHNQEGIRNIVRQIRQVKHEHLHFVIGLVNDKDAGSIFSLLPRSAFYYFCQAAIPRAMDAYDLAERAGQFKLKGTVIPRVKQALETAKKNAGKNDLVFVGGSTFVVAEIC